MTPEIKDPIEQKSIGLPTSMWDALTDIRHKQPWVRNPSEQLRRILYDYIRNHKDNIGS